MGILGGGDGLVDLYAVFQDLNFKYLVRSMRCARAQKQHQSMLTEQLVSFDNEAQRKMPR